MIDAPILITREDVQELVDWDALYEATRLGLIAGERATDSSAVSGQVLYREGSLHLKAAALEEREMLSVKANLRPNQGGVSGILLAYDLDAQRLTGIIEAGLITALRTGAIGAVAAEHLNTSSAVTVAVLGTGPVGIETAKALLRVLNVVELRLWSRTSASAVNAANSLSTSVKSIFFETAAEAAADAQVVVTATPASAPILKAEGLLPDTLILAMGADTVGKRELDSSVLDAAEVFADVPSDALRVGESAYLPFERRTEVTAISQLLQDCNQPKRRRPYLVFDSVGSSYVDAAVTALIMTRARERGIGTPVHLRR